MRRVAVITAVIASAWVAGGPADALSPFFIFFESGSARVDSRWDALLDNVPGAVRNSRPAEITLSAHADSAGSRDDNLRLSRRRGEAVRAALVARGVPREMMVVEAHGEDRPMVETADGIAEPRNRYVAIIFARCTGPAGERLC